MLPKLLPAACAGGAALLLSRNVARAQDSSIPLEKLPPNILAAVKKAVPGGTFTKAYRDQDGTDVSYDVRGKDADGYPVSVEVDEKGKVGEIETQVPESEVPDNVLKALKAKHPTFKISKCFEITDEDAVVMYEFDGELPAKGAKPKKPKPKPEKTTISVSPEGDEVTIEKS